MIKWIKKNWVKLVVAIIFAGLIYMGVHGIVENINYKKQIRVLNKSIGEKEDRIKVREGTIDDLWVKIREGEDRIDARDERIREKDKEIVGIRKERDSWKDKVEEMTPSEVVIETRGVLNCANIFERPDGILFSLDCARINLRGLKTGEFSLAMPDIKALEDKLILKDGNIADLKTEVGDLKGVIIEKDGIIADERGISGDWRDKFDLSEKKGKRARTKGRKEGTIIGGAIVTILWIFLGK